MDVTNVRLEGKFLHIGGGRILTVTTASVVHFVGEFCGVVTAEKTEIKGSIPRREGFVLPGGMVVEDSDAVGGALRETREESGICLYPSDLKLCAFRAYDNNPGDAHIYFVAVHEMREMRSRRIFIEDEELAVPVVAPLLDFLNPDYQSGFSGPLGHKIAVCMAFSMLEPLGITRENEVARNAVGAVGEEVWRLREYFEDEARRRRRNFLLLTPARES